MSKRRVFFLIVLFSFFVLSLTHPFSMVGGDDGRFIQDALRISHGQIPIVDYGTRGPILSFLVYLSSSIFGLSLFVFRLPLILATSLTAGFVFLVGYELFSRRMGIVSALLFTLSPIIMWASLLMKTETLTMLFVSISSLFLIKGLKGSQGKYFVLSGIFVGIAYIERHSALAFALTTGLTVMAYEYPNFDKKTIKRIITRWGLLFSGFVSGFFPVFLFFAYQNFSSAAATWLNYSTIAQSASTKGLPDGHQVNVYYDFFRRWILMFYDILAVQAGILFASFFVWLTAALKAFTDRKFVYLSFFGAFTFLFVYHSLNIITVGVFHKNIFLILLLTTLVAICLFWKTLIKGNYLVDYIKSTNGYGFLLPGLWVFGLLVAYSFFVPGFYAREFVPPLSIIAAAVISLLFLQESIWLKRLSIVVFASFWLIGVAWFQDPRIGGWWWTQETVYSAAHYIESNTNDGDEVFAAAPLPALLAGRRAVEDISSYVIVFSKTPDESFGGYPSANELLETLNEKPPKYTLVDGRMRNHFFKKYSFFEEFVEDNYVRVASYGEDERRGGIEVWEYKN